MLEGDLKALSDLKVLISPGEDDPKSDSEVQISDFPNLPETVVGTLFGTKSVVESLWENYGPSTFGLSPSSKPLVVEITISLGNLIREGAINPTDPDGRPMWRLGHVIKLCDQLIDETDLLAHTDNRSNWFNLKPNKPRGS